MKYAQFKKLIRQYYAPLLEPYGFTDTGSKHVVYHKQISDEIYHFIAPDMSRYGAWYDIRVFAHSPLIEPIFNQLFPDNLGVTNESGYYLHPKAGVCDWQFMYACETEDEFIDSFTREAAPAIEAFALPYLNQFKTLKDYKPYIFGSVSKFYEGAAEWEVGDKEKAKKILAGERTRLTGVKDPTGGVDAILAYIDKILSE